MDRKTFLGNIQAEIDDLSEKIEKIRNDAEERELYQALVRERDRLQEQVKELHSVAEEGWQKTMETVEENWKKLKRRIHQALA